MTILPAILRHLRYHIKNRDDILDKSLDVLGSVLTNLHDQDQVNINFCDRIDMIDLAISHVFLILIYNSGLAET